MAVPLHATALVLCFASIAVAESPLPRVTISNWQEVRGDGRQLAEGLKKRTDSVPAAVIRKLEALFAEENPDAETAGDRLQDVLDPWCLIAVRINPESRVKAERGPMATDLEFGRTRVVLIKVMNDGGITPPLAVDGDELRRAGKSEPSRWLEARILHERPFPRTLSGRKLQYVPLLLTAHESGKREATLKFDAGQGTQDLGFRAEVPILFRVRPRPRD